MPFATITYRMLGETVSNPGNPEQATFHTESALDEWMLAAANSLAVEYIVDDVEFH